MNNMKMLDYIEKPRERAKKRIEKFYKKVPKWKITCSYEDFFIEFTNLLIADWYIKDRATLEKFHKMISSMTSYEYLFGNMYLGIVTLFLKSRQENFQKYFSAPFFIEDSTILKGIFDASVQSDEIRSKNLNFWFSTPKSLADQHLYFKTKTEKQPFKSNFLYFMIHDYRSIVYNMIKSTWFKYLKSSDKYLILNPIQLGIYIDQIPVERRFFKYLAYEILFEKLDNKGDQTFKIMQDFTQEQLIIALPAILEALKMIPQEIKHTRNRAAGRENWEKKLYSHAGKRVMELIGKGWSQKDAYEYISENYTFKGKDLTPRKIEKAFYYFLETQNK